MAKLEKHGALHQKSRRNRPLLEDAMVCACFHCLNEYPFERIIKWTDEDQTAICPYCGVDAVLGFSSQHADRELLREMHDRWFKTSIRLTPDEWKDALERNAWRPAPTRPPDRK
jgi:hypothetical protein